MCRAARRVIKASRYLELISKKEQSSIAGSGTDLLFEVSLIEDFKWQRHRITSFELNILTMTGVQKTPNI